MSISIWIISISRRISSTKLCDEWHPINILTSTHTSEPSYNVISSHFCQRKVWITSLKKYWDISTQTHFVLPSLFASVGSVWFPRECFGRNWSREKFKQICSGEVWQNEEVGSSICSSRNLASTIPRTTFTVGSILPSLKTLTPLRTTGGAGNTTSSASIVDRKILKASTACNMTKTKLCPG